MTLPFRRVTCPPGREAPADFVRGEPVEADGKCRHPWVFWVRLS
jgi:hypothetical protein